MLAVAQSFQPATFRCTAVAPRGRTAGGSALPARPHARFASRALMHASKRRVLSPRLLRLRASAESGETEADTEPVTVEGMVNAGLVKFDNGKFREALKLFNQAEEMGANNNELAALTYNRACASVKLGNMEAACNDIKRAVNDYGVKYSTVVKDGDLKALRDLPIFDELSNDLKGGSNDDQMVKIRTEAKAPFRLFRFFLFGAGTIASFFALTTTIPALIGALGGGESEAVSKNVTNLGVNSAVLAASLFLLFREFKARDKEESTMRRIEELGKLKVKRADSAKMVALSRLRGVNRPVIVAGTKSQIRRVMREAKEMNKDLKDRGLVVVSVTLDDPMAASQAKLDALKKGFGNATAKDSKKEAPDLGGSDIASDFKTLELTAVDPDEWKKWVDEQMKSANVPPGFSIYVALGLDGSVVFSGTQGPNWQSVCSEFEPLDSTRTKIFQV